MKHSVFRRVTIIFAALTACMPVGCASTAKTNLTAAQRTEEEFLAALEIEPESDQKYIFLRLYDPVYKNPVYPARFLKLGITMTEVHGLKESHASIGFDLNDNFYGLTQMSRPNLFLERCTQPRLNVYTRNCKPKKSTQTTYAIAVSDEEYRAAKQFLIDHRTARYSNTFNFPIAGKSIQRKFLTPKSERLVSQFYLLSADTEQLNATLLAQSEDKFVCSTFVAFLLYNTVDSAHDFLRYHSIDFRYLSVTDLTELPGVEELFSSTWVGWEQAVAQFVAQNPQYAPFLASASD